MIKAPFPSLSGKTSIRTKSNSSLTPAVASKCFHPFQGRPLFGQIDVVRAYQNELRKFPSLSGKTSIRTRTTSSRYRKGCEGVSIPFREDLYSDESHQTLLKSVAHTRFHPFQGRPLFGLRQLLQEIGRAQATFPSLSGKTFIRTQQAARADFRIRILFPSLSGKTFIRTYEDALDLAENIASSFHPFQGRPSFGPMKTH